MDDRARPLVTAIKAVYDAATAREAQDLLQSFKPKAAKLILFVDRKFDGRELAAIRNVGADYPIEPILLHNAAMLARNCGAKPAYYRDGFELLCLERAVQNEKLDWLLLLRGSSIPSEEEFRLFNERDEGMAPFVLLGTSEKKNIAIDCRDFLAGKAVSLAAEMYRSGAVLSLSKQEIPNILFLAIEALSQERVRAVEGAGKRWKIPKRGIRWQFKLALALKSLLRFLRI